MFYKSFDDEVFAKFLNYMQKALLHKKLNYIRDYKKLMKWNAHLKDWIMYCKVMKKWILMFVIF